MLTRESVHQPNSNNYFKVYNTGTRQSLSPHAASFVKMCVVFTPSHLGLFGIWARSVSQQVKLTNTHNTLDATHSLLCFFSSYIVIRRRVAKKMRCNINKKMLPLSSGVGIPSVNTLCLCILYLCLLHPHKHSLTRSNMVLNNNWLRLRAPRSLLRVVCIFNDSWNKAVLMALSICRYYASSIPASLSPG